MKDAIDHVEHLAVSLDKRAEAATRSGQSYLTEADREFKSAQADRAHAANLRRLITQHLTTNVTNVINEQR